MALPVIKIDSATGSDTQASGAGPATALFGSAGVSASDGLSVDLTTDNPDLSGVATDGSAVLFFNDTTAGKRNFAKITGVNNGTKIVTVANALALSATKGWAIGGKRSALGTTLSRKLLENNSATADALPGWTIEFQSGHSETLSATITTYGGGDTTTGPLTIRGAPGASVLPLLTFSNNGAAFTLLAPMTGLRDFELRNSSATKTATTGVYCYTGTGGHLIEGLKIDNSTNYFRDGLYGFLSGTVVRDCTIGYCSNNGILSANQPDLQILNCYVHHCGSDGCNLGTGSQYSMTVLGCVFYANQGAGLKHGPAFGIDRVIDCVFDSNNGDGFLFTSTSQSSFNGFLLANCSFSNNGGYGFRMSGAGITEAFLRAVMTQLLNNNHYNNTSDAGHLTNLGATLVVEEHTTNINPAFTNASGGDFSSAALKELGFPLGGTLHVGTYSATYSYPDIGMQAHAAAGGGLLINPGLSGGLR